MASKQFLSACEPDITAWMITAGAILKVLEPELTDSPYYRQVKGYVAFIRYVRTWLENDGIRNACSALNEASHLLPGMAVAYSTLDTWGPDHERWFEQQCVASYGLLYPLTRTSKGRSKRVANGEAARSVLWALFQDAQFFKFCTEVIPPVDESIPRRLAPPLVLTLPPEVRDRILRQSDEHFDDDSAQPAVPNLITKPPEMSDETWAKLAVLRERKGKTLDLSELGQ